MRNGNLSGLAREVHTPWLAGLGELGLGAAGEKNASRSCARLLLSLSRLVAESWQVLLWNPREASASSTDRAADGTHLSADDILIYLSLTDGTRPWFLARVQSAGQLSGENCFYEWKRH